MRRSFANRLVPPTRLHTSGNLSRSFSPNRRSKRDNRDTRAYNRNSKFYENCPFVTRVPGSPLIPTLVVDDDVELIPRTFNPETPRQRDTFKHIGTGSVPRSPFVSSPLSIFILASFITGHFRISFLPSSSFPFYRPVSTGLPFSSPPRGRTEDADCFAREGNLRAPMINSPLRIIECLSR